MDSSPLIQVIGAQFFIETVDPVEVQMTLWVRELELWQPLIKLADLDEFYLAAGESITRELKWTPEEWLEAGYGFGEYQLIVYSTFQTETGKAILGNHFYFWVYEEAERQRQLDLATARVAAFAHDLRQGDVQTLSQHYLDSLDPSSFSLPRDFPH